MNTEIEERIKRKASYYYSIYTPTSEYFISIAEYLSMIAEGEFKKQVGLIATCDDKEVRRKMKANTLPAVTTVGMFEPSRNINNFKEHSGIIVIDIDAPSELSISDQYTFALNVRKQMDDDEYALAVHFTPSYKGIAVYVAIPFIDITKIKDANIINGAYYYAIADYIYEEYRIVCDKAPKSIASLRFISADNSLMFNSDAKVYVEEELGRYISKSNYIEKDEPTTPAVSRINISDGVSSIIALEHICSLAVKCNVDLTSGYKDWIRIGLGIANSFGEEGRPSFHKICSVYSGYNYYEANRKYTNFVRSGRGMNTVATVFKIAFDKGINYEKTK